MFVNSYFSHFQSCRIVLDYKEWVFQYSYEIECSKSFKALIIIYKIMYYDVRTDIEGTSGIHFTTLY